jgi:hypothetical protein
MLPPSGFNGGFGGASKVTSATERALAADFGVAAFAFVPFGAAFAGFLTVFLAVLAGLELFAIKRLLKIAIM